MWMEGGAYLLGRHPLPLPAAIAHPGHGPRFPPLGTLGHMDTGILDAMCDDEGAATVTVSDMADPDLGQRRVRGLNPAVDRR